MDALVSLVGAGPGDPSLLTLAAVRALSRADVVLFDALVHPAVLDHARPDAERVYVGKRAGHEGITQQEINARLVSLARAGKRVCRLKGGDPFLFGRGSEEAEVLADAGVPFEVVPGVTAALGVAAYAGISLTHRALSSSVAFVTSTEHASKSESAHDWKALATATQTVVIYMGARKIRGEMDRLRAHGRAGDTPVAVIEWGTRAEQRVLVGTVDDIAERCDDARIGTPALVVIGRVVALRDKLDWWSRRPLAGRRVVVLRAGAQAAETLDTLASRGADGWGVPVISIEAPADPSRLARAVRQLVGYRAVAFTSSNGVERFFDALNDAALDARALAGVVIAAVGAPTSEALRARGVLCDVTARESRGEGLASALGEHLARVGGAKGGRVLVPRAEQGSEALDAGLRAAGFEVDVVSAYCTKPAVGGAVEALRGALERGLVDAVLFTSGSTVTHLCDALGDAAATLLSPVLLASIGPVTSEAARSRGLFVGVEAAEARSEALIDALEAHYRKAARQTEEAP